MTCLADTMARVLATLRNFSRDLIDLLCPGRCAACGVGVDEGHRFCRDCDFALTALETRAQCVWCGAPVAFEDAPCQRCEGRGYRLFDKVIRLAVHEPPVRELVVRYKFYHGWPIGELMAERAMGLPRVRELLAEADVLVPVPLHPWRQVARGFNQAEVFARRLGRLSGVRVVRPAIRRRATQPQSLQNKADRMRNLRSAFLLTDPGLIASKRVLIVDDVITTASTVKSLAGTLRPAGPARMSVLAIAIADPTGRRFEAV